MLNALRYIKKLEEAGFPRTQAEAQVQLVLEVIEGELATKHDLKDLESKMDHRFTQFEYRIVTKLSIVTVTTVSLAIALVTWLQSII